MAVRVASERMKTNDLNASAHPLSKDWGVEKARGMVAARGAEGDLSDTRAEHKARRSPLLLLRAEFSFRIQRDREQICIDLGRATAL
jgi:hypothetical protein